ncbi:MAG: NrdH-redoxin [Nitriliruptor sp.]|nr:MAG: NrdH-redoxin [Nitriliruptor sp.]
MSDGDRGGPSAAGADSTEVVVYWRPGCPFCSRLLRWIDRNQVPVERRNIWEDPDAAAAVRAITGGDETVPTVVIGAHLLVNPAPRALSAALHSHAPELLPAPEGDTGSQEQGWLRRLLP